jgi:hypothetical protein
MNKYDGGVLSLLGSFAKLRTLNYIRQMIREPYLTELQQRKQSREIKLDRNMMFELIEKYYSTLTCYW